MMFQGGRKNVSQETVVLDKCFKLLLKAPVDEALMLYGDKLAHEIS